MLFVVLFLSAIAVARADLPVHCLRHQVEGKWKIYMSEEKSTPFPNCKHFTPHVAPHYFVTELASPDSSAYAATPWTMVYDEGFNFVRKVNGQNLALFGFNKWKKISDTMEESFCGLTQRGLGWYHNGLGIDAPTKWGCFAAVKEHQPDPIKWDLKPDLLVARGGVTVAHVDEDEDEDEDEDYDEDEDEDDEDDEDDEGFVYDPDEDEEPRPAPVQATSPDGLKDHELQQVTDDDLAKYDAESHTVLPSTERTVFRHGGDEARNGASTVVLDEEHWHREVAALNANNKHWKARVYPDLFVNKTRREVELMAGGRMHHSFSELSRVASPFAAVEANRGRPIDGGDVLLQGVNDVQVPDGVPSSWDWRDVQGKNFDSEVRQQGSCGSCFTIATVTALEARVKILTRGEWAPMLSPQQQLSCSNGNYAQGCDGGFPFLLAKHIHDYGGIAEDECAPYTAETGDCPEHCQAKNVVTAKNFGYIGGLYGACTVQDMMREVYNHGPIPVALEVGSEFMSYSSGVFDHHLHSAKKRRKDGSFELTNHATVVVGFNAQPGDDGTPPYWIIRNSWGPNWGENGYIRVAMNRDLMHVESMAVTLDPHILHPEYAHYNRDRHEGDETPVDSLLAALL